MTKHNPSSSLPTGPDRMAVLPVVKPVRVGMPPRLDSDPCCAVSFDTMTATPEQTRTVVSQTTMTPDEQVAFAWEHRDHFAAVAAYNLEVTARRCRRCDWTLPENQYRNPWTELGAR